MPYRNDFDRRRRSSEERCRGCPHQEGGTTERKTKRSKGSAGHHQLVGATGSAKDISDAFRVEIRSKFSPEVTRSEYKQVSTLLMSPIRTHVTSLVGRLRILPLSFLASMSISWHAGPFQHLCSASSAAAAAAAALFCEPLQALLLRSSKAFTYPCSLVLNFCEQTISFLKVTTCRVICRSYYLHYIFLQSTLPPTPPP
jgi:hypothetical protein